MKKRIIEVQKKLMPDFTGQAFAWGNAKIPQSTLIVNITSAEHCPSKARGLCQVTHCCYASKCERIYKYYKAKNLFMENWLYQTPNHKIIELMTAYIRYAPVAITCIRINEAGDFISLFTGCTDDEARLDQSVRYFRTTGEFAASSEIVSQVRYDPQFEDSFIGGQNYYQQLSVAAKGISMTNMTTYDSGIGGIFRTYMNQCAGGLKTPDQAVSDFRTSVRVAFPELIVE